MKFMLLPAYKNGPYIYIYKYSLLNLISLLGSTFPRYDIRWLSGKFIRYDNIYHRAMDNMWKDEYFCIILDDAADKLILSCNHKKEKYAICSPYMLNAIINFKTFNVMYSMR